MADFTSTTIYYTTDNDERWCKVTVPVPINRITLGDFKRKLPRSHAKKYLFVFEENEERIGKTVDAHIDDDNQLLPHANGAIRARLVTKDDEEDDSVDPSGTEQTRFNNLKPRDIRSTGSGSHISNGQHMFASGSRRGGSEGTASIINASRGGGGRMAMSSNGSHSTRNNARAAANNNTDDDENCTNNGDDDTFGDDDGGGDENTNFFADTDDGSLSMATGITGSIANQYHSQVRSQMFSNVANMRSNNGGYPPIGAAAHRRLLFAPPVAGRSYPPAPPASALCAPAVSEQHSALMAGGGESSSSLSYLIRSGQLKTIEISFDLCHEQAGRELGLHLIDDNYNPHGMGGICVSATTPGEAVARDGRIEPGDLLLRINDTSIVDYGTAEEAVRVLAQAADMSKKGHGPVRLTVVKHVVAWAQQNQSGTYAQQQQQQVEKFERGAPVMPIDTRCWIESQQEFDELRARGELLPPLDAVTTVDSQPGNMHEPAAAASSGQFAAVRRDNNNGISSSLHQNGMRYQPEPDNGACSGLEQRRTNNTDAVAATPLANAATTAFGGQQQAAGHYCLSSSSMDPAVIVRAMRHPVSGIKLRHHEWLKIWIPRAFTGAELVAWLRANVQDLSDNGGGSRTSKSACKSYAKRLLSHGFIREPFETNATGFSERRTYVFPGDDFAAQQTAVPDGGMTTPSIATTLTGTRLSDGVAVYQQQRAPLALQQMTPSIVNPYLMGSPSAVAATAAAVAVDTSDTNDAEELEEISANDSVSQVATRDDTFRRRIIVGGGGGGGGLPPFPMPHHFNQSYAGGGGGAARVHANFPPAHVGSPALSATHYMRQNSSGHQQHHGLHAVGETGVTSSAMTRQSMIGAQPSPKVVDYHRQQQLLISVGDVTSYLGAVTPKAAGAGSSDGTASDSGYQLGGGMAARFHNSNNNSNNRPQQQHAARLY